MPLSSLSHDHHPRATPFPRPGEPPRSRRTAWHGLAHRPPACLLRVSQNRDLKKKAERDKSYQFMLRLKVPVGEVPADLFRTLDDLSNKYGQGDLRATTRQAFQLPMPKPNP